MRSLPLVWPGLLRAVATLIAAAMVMVGLAAPPAAADGPPVREPGFHCNLVQLTPPPSGYLTPLEGVGISFRCYDASERQIIRPFTVAFIIDGRPREFERTEQHGAEVLRVKFAPEEGLPAGVHTARVVVEESADFSWAFWVQ